MKALSYVDLAVFLIIAPQITLHQQSKLGKFFPNPIVLGQNDRDFEVCDRAVSRVQICMENGTKIPSRSNDRLPLR